MEAIAGSYQTNLLRPDLCECIVSRLQFAVMLEYGYVGLW